MFEDNLKIYNQYCYNIEAMYIITTVRDSNEVIGA